MQKVKNHAFISLYQVIQQYKKKREKKWEKSQKILM